MMTRPDVPNTLPVGALARFADAPPEIEFTPVVRLRRRRGGWDADRQRGFIAALARCGSVAAAARSVGLSARGAYRLADAPDGDSFVRAWDQAIDFGMARMRGHALGRSIEGDYVPVYRRGQLVQVEHRRNDRLAIAVLGGRDCTADDLRRTALSRRGQRLDMAALDAARAERARALAEAETAFRDTVDRLIDKVAVSVGHPTQYPDG